MITTAVLTLVFIHLIQTFSERDQAVYIILSNVRVVIHQLAELGFQAATEESYGILVGEVGQAGTESREQGYVLANRTFLLQVFDLVEGVFGIVGINEALTELKLENLIG